MSQQITTTQAALTIAYGKAIDRYPDEQARILKGARIANEPFIVLEHDGYTTVKSSDGTRNYTINGTCDCPDRTPRCKHVWAKALHRKMASIWKAMHAPEHQSSNEISTERGIVHTVEGGFFFVPYGGPRGRFVTSADFVVGSYGTEWPIVQTEREKYEAAYYEEYGAIA